MGDEVWRLDCVLISIMRKIINHNLDDITPSHPIRRTRAAMSDQQVCLACALSELLDLVSEGGQKLIADEVDGDLVAD